MNANKSPIASDSQTLDKGKLVSITNRGQAICLFLSNDDLVPDAAKAHYAAANELLIKAMRASIG